MGFPYIRKPPSHLVCTVYLVKHGTIWARKADIWPQMTKMSTTKIGLFMVRLTARGEGGSAPLALAERKCENGVKTAPAI